MKDIFVGAIIIVLLALCVAYIIKEKKGGTKCIGCPHSKICSSRHSCSGNDIDKDSLM